MSALLAFWASHAEEFWRLLGQHVLLVLVSTGLAVAIGVPVGIVAARRPRVGAPLAGLLWFRVVGRLPDDQALHRCLLTYVSDYHLLATSTLPHGVPFLELQLASIDHAIWFHRDLRVDEWLLYAIESPSASGARGFCRGSIFTRDGRLVASVAQEGLIRQDSRWTKPAGNQK